MSSTDLDSTLAAGTSPLMTATASTGLRTFVSDNNLFAVAEFLPALSAAESVVAPLR